MNKSFEELFERFKRATGLKDADPNSTEYLDEFAIWIRNGERIGDEYTEFLKSLGIEFEGANCAEVVQNIHDTVVLPFQTRIITPSSKPFRLLGIKDRVIEGDMRVLYGYPTLVATSEDGKKQIQTIPRDEILTYMTQNPISRDRICKWENLHNSGNNNIIVGVYGNIYDRDRRAKIKALQEFRDILYANNVTEESTVSGDRYFYVVASGSHKQKTRVLVRTNDMRRY